MLQLLYVTKLLSICISMVAAGNIAGYHYEKPPGSTGFVSAPANLAHGHSFGPIPTIEPLPPVPALPPLPTARAKGAYVQTQTIYQTHPAASSIGKIAQQYIPQQSSTSSVKSAPTGSDYSSDQQTIIDLGSSISNPPPPPPPPPAVQPLRVPFGKQAVINFPSGGVESISSFDPSSRQLHQYAVIEIIDNDIEQNTQPFLSTPFFDSYRARGAGATPPPLGSRLLGSRSSAAFLGQQQSVSQLPSNDAVALGSGGLGFIRLANGNVYLGSGSLGYVSGQQHTQEVNEARTRTGASQPDALHFGHGPLGDSARFNKFSYRFK